MRGMRFNAADGAAQTLRTATTWAKRLVAAGAACMVGTGPVAAQSTWLPTSGTLAWTTGTAWSTGSYPDAVDAIAVFPVAPNNVTLDNTTVTIGTINYTAASGNLVIGTTGTTFSDTDFIRLAVTSGVPVISVASSNAPLFMYAQLTGSQGLQKNGAGIYSPRYNSLGFTYTGTNVFNGGSIQIARNDHLGDAANPIDVTAASTLQVYSSASTSAMSMDRAIGLSAGSLTIQQGAAANSLTLNGAISGTGGLTLNTGTFVLNGANTYSGPTTVRSAVVTLGAGSALAANTLTLQSNTGTVGGSTINLGGGSLTVPSLSMTIGTGSTVQARNVFTNGSLAVTGGNLAVNSGGANALTGTTTLDMSGLTNFSYSNAAGAVSVQSTATSAAAYATVFNLANAATGSNALTATSVSVGPSTNGITTSTSTLALGRNTNLINTGTLQIGGYRGSGVVAFQSGTAAGNLVLRGTAGGESRVDLVNVGFKGGGDNLGAGVLDTTGGSIDARVSSLIVGRYLSNAGNAQTGTFTMAAGTIDVTTLTIGQITQSTMSVAGPTQTNTVNQNGGIAKIGTITLGDNQVAVDTTGSGAPNFVSTYNLAGGTLAATAIASGTGSAGAGTTRRLAFTGGTLTTYDSATDLLVNGVSGSRGGFAVVLSGSAAKAFDAGAGRMIRLGDYVAISGSNTSYTKTGAGTLVMGGTSYTNSYTGTANLAEGTVRLAAANSMGNNSTLVIAPASGATTLDLAGFNHGYGSLSNTGSADLAVIQSTSGTGVLSVGSLNATDAYSGRITSAAGGLVGLTKVGTGTMTLSGSANSLGGPLAVNNGRLVVDPGAAGSFTSTGRLQLASGSGAIAVLDIASGSNNFTSATGIVGIGDGAGASTVNVLGGDTTLALAINRFVVGNKGVGTLAVAGGSLTVTGNQPIYVGGDTGFALDNATGAMTVTGGTLAITGTGTFALGVNVSGSVPTTGASGSVNLNGGVFATARAITVATGSNPSSGTVNFNGGTLRALASSGNFIAVTTANVQDGGALIDTNGNAVTVSQALVAAGANGGLTKLGAGTLTLSGNNTYTGPTAVSAGVLSVNGDQSAATGAVAVAAGATLAGTGTVGGATTIQSGATLAPGASPGTLSFTQGLTLAAGGNYNWQLYDALGTAGSASGWDLVSVGGVLDIAATTADPFRINLWSLSGVGPDVTGDALNFSSATSGTWRIASATGGITNFATDKFQIITGATNGTGGFTNAFTGTFSLAQSGNDLNLVYTGGGGPSVITINVPSGTETQTAAGHPLLAGTTPVEKTGEGTVVFDQANTLTGPTTVSQGTLQLATADTLSSSAVTVAAGATLSVAPQVSTVVPALVNNGLVDVGLGGLTVASGQTVETLIAGIVAGRSDGTWSGTSGITSSAAATQSERAVGWLNNGDGSFTVAFAAAGDWNVNGVVDFDDVLQFVSANLYDTGLPATWADGDFDYNGVVDFDDVLASVSAGLFDTGPYNTAPGGLALMGFGGDDPGLLDGGFTAVPEPATYVLVAIGAACAAAWQRRRMIRCVRFEA